MQRGIGNKLDRFNPGHQGRKSLYFDYGKLAQVLQIQRSDGSYLAVPYVYLQDIDYEPSMGMIVKIGNYKITIRGRRLDYLFEQLCQYQVSQIRSAIHEFEDEVPANDEQPPMGGFEVDEIHRNKGSLGENVQPLDFIESIDVEMMME